MTELDDEQTQYEQLLHGGMGGRGAKQEVCSEHWYDGDEQQYAHPHLGEAVSGRVGC